MEALTRFGPKDVFLFSLILTRLSGLCFVAPIYGAEQVPKRIRILLALSIALILYPAFQLTPIVLPSSVIEYAVIIFKELSLGMIIGFLSLAMFFGFQVGGQIISIHMGMNMADMIDPFTDIQITAIGTFIGLLITVAFLVSNGHHFILKAIVDSFQYAPIMAFQYKMHVFQQAIDMFNIIIVTAFKISAPNMMAFFAVSLVFAFIARLVPQMNVFILSLPVKIGTGVIILVMTLPIIVALFFVVMERVFSTLYYLLSSF